VNGLKGKPLTPLALSVATAHKSWREAEGARQTGNEINRMKDIRNQGLTGSIFTVFKLYKSIPNTLTVLRLLGTPLTLWAMVKGQFGVAFWIFLAVCLTDWLDGYLARRWQATSRLGQILDPLADKILLVSTYLALALWAFIPPWLATCVIFRDLLILAVSSGIALSQKTIPPLAPQLIGKLSTALQMLFIGLTLAGGVPVLSIPGIRGVIMLSLLYGVALATVVSGIIYAQVAFTAFRKDKKS